MYSKLRTDTRHPHHLFAPTPAFRAQTLRACRRQTTEGRIALTSLVRPVSGVLRGIAGSRDGGGRGRGELRVVIVILSGVDVRKIQHGGKEQYLEMEGGKWKPVG
jgi:hypothetical protein